MRKDLKEIIDGIGHVDQQAMEQAWQCWDSLCKPLRGLGWLEEVLVQIAGIYGTPRPHPDKRAVVIMGADNGVVKEGVTQTDSSVTIQVLENMGDGLSTACVMCSLAGCEVIPVNIGSLTDGKHPRIRNRVVRHGTGNIAEGPAMTREECEKAVLTGVDVVCGLKKEGYDLIVTGEMGIGNTTTSSACAAVLFGQDAEAVTGRGAGLSTEGLERKIRAIKKAIRINQPDKNDAIDVIAKVGDADPDRRIYLGNFRISGGDALPGGEGIYDLHPLFGRTGFPAGGRAPGYDGSSAGGHASGGRNRRDYGAVPDRSGA